MVLSTDLPRFLNPLAISFNVSHSAAWISFNVLMILLTELEPISLLPRTVPVVLVSGVEVSVTLSLNNPPINPVIIEPAAAKPATM